MEPARPFSVLVGKTSTRWIARLPSDTTGHKISSDNEDPGNETTNSSADIEQLTCGQLNLIGELGTRKQEAQAAISDFVTFFSPFASVQSRAAMYVSNTSAITSASQEDRMAIGSVTCHPVEFSLFTDVVISEVAGLSPYFMNGSGPTGDIVPTLAVCTSRGTMLVQVPPQSFSKEGQGWKLSFTLIQAAESKNLLPCRGAYAGRIGGSVVNSESIVELCRVLAEDEVRCPIERHDRAVQTPSYHTRPAPSISVSSASGLPPFLIDAAPSVYCMGDILMSGWMTKWPMKSQYIGTSTRRFFLLLAAHKKSSNATSVLVYWTHPPKCLQHLDFKEEGSFNAQQHKITQQSSSYHDDDSIGRSTVMSPNGLQDILNRDDIIPMSTAKGQLVLSGASTVHIKKSPIFGFRYLEITAPSDSLCVECDSPDTELSWFSKLSAVLNYQRMNTVLLFPKRKIFALKYGVENGKEEKREWSFACPRMTRDVAASSFKSVVLSPHLRFYDDANSLVGNSASMSTHKKMHAISTAKSGFNLTQDIKTTVTVLEVAADQAVLSVPCNHMLAGTDSRPPVAKPSNFGVSPGTSMAATSMEDQHTLSASPSEGFSFNSTFRASPTFDSRRRQPQYGFGHDNCEVGRGVEAPAVSVDSGVDMDESTGLSSVNRVATSGNVAARPPQPDAGATGGSFPSTDTDSSVAVLAFQTETTTQQDTTRNDNANKRKSTKRNSVPQSGAAVSNRAKKEELSGKHFVYMMDGTDWSYLLLPELKSSEEGLTLQADHSKAEFSLSRLSHVSTILHCPRPMESPNTGNFSCRLFVVAGKNGYLGIGYAASYSGVVVSPGGIKRTVKTPVLVESVKSATIVKHATVDRDIDDFEGPHASAGRSSFSISKNTANIQDQSRATDNHVHNLEPSSDPLSVILRRLSDTSYFQTSVGPGCFNSSATKCSAWSFFESAICGVGRRNEDVHGGGAHPPDAEITSVAHSHLDVPAAARCNAIPCTYCDTTESNIGGRTFSEIHNSIIVSGDDVGVLCIWQLVTLSTLVVKPVVQFTATSAVSTPNKKSSKRDKKNPPSDPLRPENISSNCCADVVKIRSKHKLAHRLFLEVPITSVDVSPDGQYAVVCTVTQALLFGVISDPPSACTTLPSVRLQLVSVLEDCTNKDTLFRHRYAADLKSSPGRIRLWKMSTALMSVKAADGSSEMQNFFQYSDLKLENCLASTSRILGSLRERCCEDTAKPGCESRVDSIMLNTKPNVETFAGPSPLLTIQDYIAWMGDGFGVISACQVLREEFAQDCKAEESADKWNMTDFEEYIRLRNRVKKWWRENSSRVLILHEKNRDPKASSAGQDTSQSGLDEAVSLTIALNRALIVPPGGACGQPTPTTHTCAPALAADAYHHSFRTASARLKQNEIDEPSCLTTKEGEIHLPPSYFGPTNLPVPSQVDSILRQNSKRGKLRNGPEGVDITSPLFAAAVTKEFRGHGLVKCILQTMDNNHYYKGLVDASTETVASTESDKRFDRLLAYEDICAFEMLCSLIYQLHESFGGEYLSALQLSLQAELSRELMVILSAKPTADKDEFVSFSDSKVSDTAYRNSQQSSVFKLANYMGVNDGAASTSNTRRDSFSHLINGIVARVITVPVVAVGQLDECVDSLRGFIRSANLPESGTTGIGNLKEVEVADATNLLQYICRIRDTVSIFGNTESGLFIPALMDLFKIPGVVHSYFQTFASDTERIPLEELRECTRRVLETFVLSPMANLERIVNADSPLSLVVAISGFDHSQSPNLIKLVHNHSNSASGKANTGQGINANISNVGSVVPLTADLLKKREHALMLQDAYSAANAINSPILEAQANIDIKKCEQGDSNDPFKIISPPAEMGSPSEANDFRRRLHTMESTTPREEISNLSESNEREGTLSGAAGAGSQTSAGRSDQRQSPGAQLRLISELIQRSPVWVRFVLSSRNKTDQTQERSALSTSTNV